MKRINFRRSPISPTALRFCFDRASRWSRARSLSVSFSVSIVSAGGDDDLAGGRPRSPRPPSSSRSRTERRNCFAAAAVTFRPLLAPPPHRMVCPAGSEGARRRRCAGERPHRRASGRSWPRRCGSPGSAPRLPRTIARRRCPCPQPPSRTRRPQRCHRSPAIHHITGCCV